MQKLFGVCLKWFEKIAKNIVSQFGQIDQRSNTVDGGLYSCFASNVELDFITMK